MPTHPRTDHVVTRAAIMTVTVLLSIAGFCLRPGALSAQTETGCPWCTSPSRCETIEQNASDSCGITAGQYCQNGQGLCIWGGGDEDLLAKSFGVDRDDIRAVRTERGVMLLVPVAGRKFAAWNCRGDLVFIAEIEGDRIKTLNTAAYAEQFRLDRTLGRPVSSDAAPVPATIPASSTGGS